MVKMLNSLIGIIINSIVGKEMVLISVIVKDLKSIKIKVWIKDG